MRVDFNVPMKNGEVTDDSRIRAALPTVRWLREQGSRVVLLSHLGRPKGQTVPEMSLRPVKDELEQLLGMPITFIEDATDPNAARTTKRMKRGEVALVENTRFIAGEEQNDKTVAGLFAELGDFFVNDAFGVAHRAHASTEAVAHLLKPAVVGFLMARELEYLGAALEDPKRPFIAILGGAKISGKIDVLDALLPKVDEILIGGAMACTFFLAMGLEVGESLVELDRVDMAKGLLQRAGNKLVLPTGVVVAKSLEGGERRSVQREAIPEGYAVFDIDEKTADHFATRVTAAGTVVWNGPMGVFESPPFDQGTRAMARALAKATELGAITIVGGGDSVAAIAETGLTDKVSHVSTGGGASLEFLEGKELPGVAALDDV